MPQPTRWIQLTGSQKRLLKGFLLEQARHVGPSTVRVLKTLWADSVIEAARDVYQLLRLSGRYGADRLEAACRRAAYYQQSRNGFTIEWIIQKGYDWMPLTPYTDISGRFLFAIIDGDCGHPRQP